MADVARREAGDERCCLGVCYSRSSVPFNVCPQSDWWSTQSNRGSLLGDDAPLFALMKNFCGADEYVNLVGAAVGEEVSSFSAGSSAAGTSTSSRLPRPHCVGTWGFVRVDCEVAEKDGMQVFITNT